MPSGLTGLIHLLVLLSFASIISPSFIHNKGRLSTPHINDKPPKHAEKQERVLQQDYEAIRIHVDYSNLLGVDPVKEEYVQNQLMPSVISYFQGTLKVRRSNEKLQIDAQCGTPSLIPNLTNTEIEADLAVAISVLNSSSAFLSSIICRASPTDNRPYFGVLSFNIAYMAINTITARQINFKTTIREFVHLLGFVPVFFSRYLSPATGKPYQYPIWMKNVNGKYVGVLSIEPLTSRLREYFGCPSLEGVYLENQGGLDAGIAYQYFERRIFNNEIMTATISAESVISEFTLSLLESTGWYIANYNMTEPFNWGRGQGCQFLDGPCTNNNGIPNFEEFCDAKDNIACSFTARGIGYCGVGAALDPFADSCPYYTFLPAFDCENPGNQIASLLVGEVYGESSRCYTSTLAENANEEIKGAYCFVTNCTETRNGSQLEVKIGNQSIICDKKQSVSVPGYFGKLDCPDPNEFCLRANLAFCPTGCSGRGVCIKNQCQCPAGWGGADCSERVLELSCERCRGQVNQECFGDQCIITSQKPIIESQSFSSKIQTLNLAFVVLLWIILYLSFK